MKKAPLRELLAQGPYLDCVTTPVSKVRERNEQCEACPYWRACMGGCRAIACAFTGDYLAADEAKCLFFKGGYLEKVDHALNASGGKPYRCIDDLDGLPKEGIR